MAQAAASGHKTTERVPRGSFCALGRSELVGCGVRVAAMAAASLNRSGASAMPMIRDEKDRSPRYF